MSCRPRPPDLPRYAKEAKHSFDQTWNLATRTYLANRGVWEPILIHGPSISFAHRAEDVDRYPDVLNGWIDKVVAAHE